MKRNILEKDRNTMHYLNRCGWSTKRIAAEINCSPSSVRRILSGNYGRKKKELRDDVSIEDLRAVGLKVAGVKLRCPATIVTARGRVVCPQCDGKEFIYLPV